MSIFNLDVTKEHCPMTFVKTKIELNKLQAGDVLNVKLLEGEPLQNVPRSATEQGFKVLSVKETETPGVYNVEIEK
jgi:TusA-related sulfurtransferase